MRELPKIINNLHKEIILFYRLLDLKPPCMCRMLWLGVLLMLSASCSRSENKSRSVEAYRQEIRDTEKEFEKMAADSGLAAAFSHFAADSGVVNASDSLFIGKDAIRRFYQGWAGNDMRLRWSPDFVDVSAAGDLGYTYGKYIFTYSDSTGRLVQSNGIFHTVWKRQQDGTWRFVWD
jgi:ketosteroid isomerase-like protein